MNDDMTGPARGGRLNWLLDDLVRRLAGSEKAVVLSGDGLPLARSAELDREGAEHLAAMASAFSSLSRGVGERFGKGGMLQTVVELEDGFLVVTEAGTGACLALLASPRADLGMVAYEMNVIVQQVGSALTAGPRALPAEPPPSRVP
ncbi:MAG TPA: roadblock/LC7 domain-containing protein [Trebonia sp.]|jgi:predicted regulator of Ras-like GTPase activity (Roadblock/LC7/MglB family)|nr:roadblock/LC7 domain-containing protein [Trebonia sp.]